MIRTLRREGLPPDLASPILAHIHLIAIHPGVHLRAERLAGTIKSLDAIHLATAMQLEGCTVATHDTTMASAATRLGLDVVDPME